MKRISRKQLLSGVVVILGVSAEASTMEAQYSPEPSKPWFQNERHRGAHHASSRKRQVHATYEIIWRAWNGWIHLEPCVSKIFASSVVDHPIERSIVECAVELVHKPPRLDQPFADAALAIPCTVSQARICEVAKTHSRPRKLAKAGDMSTANRIYPRVVLISIERCIHVF